MSRAAEPVRLKGRPMLSTTEILERSIETIETLGWVRGNYRTEDGCCVVGAMLVATGLAAYGFNEECVLPPEVETAAIEILQTVQPDGLEYPRSDYHKNLTRWNDEQPEDAEDVVEVLKETCNRLHGQEFLEQSNEL